MDDRRFDSLVKSLASGASRRKVLKGLLGLGGAAAVGGTLLEGPAEAARRPTLTPKPVKCPGVQTWNAGLGKCVCPPNLSQCVPGIGPACCNDTAVAPGSPTYSECCDNACCNGTCYGEELCCATNFRPGEQSPTNRICDTTSGQECCLFSDKCCIVDGCCATVCYGGSVGADSCCPAEQFCPSASGSADLCCDVDETCCGGGTSGNYCANFGAGGCCEASNCPPPANGACAVECIAGQCQPVNCSDGQICCQGACVSSEGYEACPADPDECCARETDVCCGGACCARGSCNAAQQCCDSSQFLCGMSCCEKNAGLECCGGNTCCPEGKCANGSTCCTGNDVACAADCCPPERCTQGVGCCPEGFLACTGGICCKADVYRCSTTGPGCECLPGTEACGLTPGGCCPTGQCNHDTGSCCAAGTSPCGDDDCCADDPCENFVCVPACTHCEGGQCVDDDDFTSCIGGYCQNGICNNCISNSSPGSLFSCSFDVECCGACCLNSALAANACQTQFEGNSDLLGACVAYLAPFLGGDLCIQNPLPIPGTEATVELPCQSMM